jgi:hypothetical protein
MIKPGDILVNRVKCIVWSSLSAICMADSIQADDISVVINVAYDTVGSVYYCVVHKRGISYVASSHMKLSLIDHLPM